jgi:hypothetical protein
MKPVAIEVITYAPTAFYHCQHCELAFGEVGLGERVRREAAASALPDDLAQDFQALSDWVHGLLAKFGSQIRVRIVDAASIEGFVKSVRHRIGRYPAVLIDGRAAATRGDFQALEPMIEQRLAATGRL